MSKNQTILRTVDEIPSLYRQVFSEYPCFNVVQSAVLDSALKTDKPLVVSAPTGSGKTAVFELAIIRHLMQNQNADDLLNNKIIYISPIKALCVERLMDWHKKFSPFGVKCLSVTSDTDEGDFRNILQYNLFVATPEKWDVLTRRWRENSNLIESIKLFLIDEVHLLNADSRGATLEVIVSRMKTALETRSFKMPSSIRFIAVSATIPNIEDITEWICGNGSAELFSFSDETRPVKLNKIVIGYHFNPQNQSVFKFDMSLTYKLPPLIAKYAEGKPTLIFCNTRKSVEMTANHLLSNMQVRLGDELKEKLKKLADGISDLKLKQLIMNGIAIHHAGMAQENRHTIEHGFRSGNVPVLVTTSTLAMGVNLPAHLVIIKCTKCYFDGGYKDYDEMSIFQMIGRAGRCQFDTSATALILTSYQDKAKYDKMLECSQPVESNLHKHLTEHLNAEVVLKTITDLDVAMRWLSSTYLYVRARKCPEKYKFPAGLSKEKVDKKLLDICQIDLNKLVRGGMIKMTDSIEISPTLVGEIMAKYYIAFDTMKLFTEITGVEVLKQLLAIFSKCKEFSEIYLRNNDKRILNILNKNKHKQSNRFPLNGRIKTVDMKINVIIQAVLGNLDISDQSIICDSTKIMRNCQRIAKCLIEYLESRDKVYNALLNAIILAKCFKVKLWESSPYVSKQLSGVGHVMSTLLAKAGKVTFKDIADSNPRHIEMIINRKPPFGNTLVEEAKHIPEYTLKLAKHNNSVKLNIALQNSSILEEKCTVDLNSFMVLLVGDSENNILLYEKYSHLYILEMLEVEKTVILEGNKIDWIKANLISENWVGFDCELKLDMCQPVSDKNAVSKQIPKQTYMDSYMPSVKPKNVNNKVHKPNSLKSTLANKKTQSQKRNTIETKLLRNTSSPPKITSKDKENIYTDEDEFLNLNFSKFENMFDKTAEKNNPIHTKELKTGAIVKEKPKAFCLNFDSNGSDNNTSSNNNLNVNMEDSISNITENRETIFSELSNLKVCDQMTRKYSKTEKKAESVDKKSEQKECDNKKNYDTSHATFPLLTKENKSTNIEEKYSNDIPSKSIKWRSPLIHSPNVRFSPRSHISKEFGQSSNCLLNISMIPELENPCAILLNSQKRSSLKAESPKKVLKTSLKRKNPFPLSDQENVEEEDDFSANDKDMEESNLFEQLSSRNNMKLKKRDLNASQSSVGNYYTQLMQSTQSKKEKNILSDRILEVQPSQSWIQPNKHEFIINNPMPGDFQISQDLFSEADISQNISQNHKVLPSNYNELPAEISPNHLRSTRGYQRETPTTDYNCCLDQNYGRRHLEECYIPSPAYPRHSHYFYPSNHCPGHSPSYRCCSHQCERPAPTYSNHYFTDTQSMLPSIWRNPVNDFGRCSEYYPVKEQSRFLFSRPSQQLSHNEDRFGARNLGGLPIYPQEEKDNNFWNAPNTNQKVTTSRYSENCRNKTADLNLSQGNLGALFSYTPKKQLQSSSQQISLPYGKPPTTLYPQSYSTPQQRLLNFERFEEGINNRISVTRNEFCVNAKTGARNAVDEEGKVRNRYYFQDRTL